MPGFPVPLKIIGHGGKHPVCIGVVKAVFFGYNRRPGMGAYGKIPVGYIQDKVFQVFRTGVGKIAVYLFVKNKAGRGKILTMG
jgi:hypothetical protein